MIARKLHLIHATLLAMEPINEAFQRLWPTALRTHVMDDSLTPDLEAAGGINQALIHRFELLAKHAEESGAEGILFTCSAFGPAIEAAAAVVRVPTLKPNEAMFLEALQLCAKLGRPGRIGMISTFAASVESMRDELSTLAQQQGIEFTLDVECPAGALAALRDGHAQEHDRLVNAAAKRFSTHDVVMLGQFSTSHMRAPLEAETGRPVLSSPDSAVRLLKRAVEQNQ